MNADERGRGDSGQDEQDEQDLKDGSYAPMDEGGSMATAVQRDGTGWRGIGDFGFRIVDLRGGKEPQMKALAEDYAEGCGAGASAATMHRPRRAGGQADGRGCAE